MRPSLTFQKDLGCSQFFAGDSPTATTTTTAATATIPAATATSAVTSLTADYSTKTATIVTDTDAIATAAAATAAATSPRTTATGDDDDINQAINRPLHINDVGPMYLRKGGPSSSPSYEPSTLPPSTLPPGATPVPTNTGGGSGNSFAPTPNPSPSPTLLDGKGSAEVLVGGNITHIARAHRNDIVPVGLDTSDVTQMVRDKYSAMSFYLGHAILSHTTISHPYIRHPTLTYPLTLSITLTLMFSLIYTPL